MPYSNLLVTAHADDASPLLQSEFKSRLIHLPLEEYNYGVEQEQALALDESFENFEFIIHANKRNTAYFLNWLEENGQTERAKKRINMTGDSHAADLLEKAGIPAIVPKPDARPIDILEFMLRISRSGGVLYPCPEGSAEEMPGLLHELEIPVSEFYVCKPATLPAETLSRYRESIKNNPLDAVLFHSRGSIIRVQTAFPELDLDSVTKIAASAGVSWKMRKEGLEPDYEAGGTWRSVVEYLNSAG
jgi:uroporphyrinogen-III synthase